MPGIHDVDTNTEPVVVSELQSSEHLERVISGPETSGHVLLAIDTSLGSSVALSTGGRVFEVSNDDTRGHAEAIGGQLKRVFEFAGTCAEDVTGVVAGIGPGPFTGLRIGIAAAHAFATGAQIPLHPLQGHEAVAFAIHSGGGGSRVRVVQDARRRELFVTEYSGIDWVGMPIRREGPRLELRSSYREMPEDVWPERIPAARLVQLAARRLNAGIAFEKDRALYLRAPDVAPPAAVKRVSA